MKKITDILFAALSLHEGTNLAKQYVAQNKLSKQEFDALKSIDPTKDKVKYVDWMAKQWVAKNVTDIDELRNTIEEFDSFLQKGKTKNKNVDEYSFESMKAEVKHLNDSGEGISVKDLESDYDTLKDDDDLLVMSPHTHEASRKLGLSHFAYRDCEGGKKDSSWCTTYKAPNHFNDYYYTKNITFYYVKVRSEKLQKDLKAAGFGPEYFVVAITVDDSKKEAYDALDKKFSGEKLNRYLSVINLR